MFGEPERYHEVHTVLSRSRIIFINEDVTKELATTFCSLLIYYNAVDPTADITVMINTVGGDAMALTSMYDTMNLIQAPIATIGVGKIYSAGVILLAAGTKGKRFMFKNAEVMVHGLQCLYPEIPNADSSDASIYFNYLDSLNNRILKILAKHTGQTLNKVSQDSKRDLYLDSKKALKYGLIDKIL